MNALTASDRIAFELARAGVTDGEGGKAAPTSRYTLWYADTPGFGLRCYPSGRRIYVAQVRIGARARTVTICNAKLITLRKARGIARRVILSAQVGQNPAEERKRVRALPTFDRFLETYWSRMAPSWRPSTRKTQFEYRRLHLDGAFRGIGIDAIDQPAVVAWYGELARSSGPGAATRVLDILSAIFSKAEEWGMRSGGSNPCRGIRRYKGRKMERHLTEAELCRLGAAIDELRQRSPLRGAALLLLILTGCRYSEILGLTWAEVKGGRLRLSDSKTGPRTVWLGDEAKEVLASIPRGTSNAKVFEDPVTGKVVTLASTWQNVKLNAGLVGVRLHDLRHTFASRAAALSEPLPMIGSLLGHATIQSTARYAHLDDAALIDAAEIIGRAIEGQML